jgi:hypothetical protein
MSKREQFEGYGWIKVKKYKMDETKSWEERYRELEQHHIAETTFLINQVRALADEIDELNPTLSASVKESYWGLVLRCLSDVVGLSAVESARLVGEYRGRLAESKDSDIEDFVYHDDALNLALNLAGKSAGEETEAMREKYQEIRKGTGW